MKVRLLQDAKVKHSAGEIVEVSPAEFHFLTSLNVAIPVKDVAESPTPKKAAKKK